jgi:hypothetical protein
MEQKLIKSEIESRIFNIRGEQVMLDFDLADLYEIPTKSFNQSVQRNSKRFPKDFIFRLNAHEFDELVTNCDRFNNQKHRSTFPLAFTELGISMLSSILKSQTAIDLNILIIRVFVALRKDYYFNKTLLQRVSNVESILFEHQKKFNALETNTNYLQSATGIFFNDQVFDAYVFSSELICKAKKSLILIDNYIDETTLLQLSKRNEKCRCTIYTERMSDTLRLDLKKYNSQYQPIEIRILKNAHDRFLILDEKELYHIGASLKDLGKRWFAFSRMDGFLNEVLDQIGS